MVRVTNPCVMTIGLKVFTSNRLEFLADDLAELTRHRVGSIFQPETVVVQSQGMARWLSLHLAERNAICANYRFPFPNAFVHQMFRALWSTLPDQPDCRLDVLVWKVMQHLPERLHKKNFVDLKHYLGDAQDSRKLFQLSQKIAWLFDQYLIFRPEWIEAWDQEEPQEQADLWQAPHWQTELWQEELWRVVSKGFQRPHMVTLRKEFLRKISSSKFDPAKFPERVSVFGISALPPFHMNVLEELAKKIEVNVFLLEPCREYWGYITAPREAEQTLRKHPQLDAATLHLERGNRLLASMGKLGRDFLNLIFRADNLTPIERFSEPDESTLLRTIQSDILLLRDRGHDDDCPQQAIATEDDSIQIHSCHSPMREMEVLHDAILGWLDRDPTLKPADILVLTPDIETYAPFIQAVFGSPESPAHQIPFSLADRDPRNEGQILEPFFTLLALVESRLGVAQVLSLLECPAVRKRFALGENDLIIVRKWVEDAGIRWGIDAEHRGRFNIPEFDANSWRKGLNNLLLGSAMSNESEELFGNLLPMNRVEGSASHTLGNLIEFTERLFALSSTLPAPRSLTNWEILLRKICSDFFALDEESEHEIKLIWNAAKKLRANGEAAAFEEEVSLAIIVEFLNGELRENLQPVGFLTGGITFAALKPMRSLPVKIICLTGMNDDSFPRHSSQLGFDLMAKEPKLGDRSTRDDDRYLFLESILSAREKLHISYVGQSIRDNSHRPPSVLVSELTDYITQGFELESDEDILAKQIVKTHRLQAFSESYFIGGPLFSFSVDNFRGCEALRQRDTALKPFFPGTLSEPNPDWRTVTLDQLIAFFTNPAEFILSERLGIRLPRVEEQIDEREPFAIDSRDGYAIKQALVERALAGQDFKKTQSVLAAVGQLPIGEIGEASFNALSDQATEFIAKLQPFCPKDRQRPIPFDLALGEFRLRGQLDAINSVGLLRYRCGRLKPVDLLRLWIPFLVWNKVDAKRAVRGIHVAEDETFGLNPVANAEKYLADLLNLYWKGLSAPLKFFPQTSYAFAEGTARVARGSEIDPLKEAWKKWGESKVRDGDGYRTVQGENVNPYVALAFSQTDPLDAEFEETALKIFGPLLQHQLSLE